MGLRFRKSFRIFPGVRATISKTGLSFSFGFKGFRVTKRADGNIQKTVTIPGTGISYVDVDSKRSKKVKNATSTASCPHCGKRYKIHSAHYCSKCGEKL